MPAGVGVALRLGQVVHHVGDDRLGRLEAERRRVADVELEDLVALGLEALGLDQDRPAYVVADVLELAALDDRSHGAQSRRGSVRPARITVPRMGLPRRQATAVARSPACATSATRPIIVTAKVLFRVLGPAVPDARHRARARGPAARCWRSTTSPTSTSSSAGWPRSPRKRLVRFMAKREVFDHADRRAGDALDAPHLGRPGRRRGLAGRGAALPPGRRGGRDLPRGHDLAAPSRSRS